MREAFGGVLQFLDPSSFNTWAAENIIWLTALITISVIGVYFFKPKLMYWLQLIRRRRLYWQYQALVGRAMSKRARDQELAGDLYDFLLDRVQKGKMTHKEKRRRLRLYEIVFELEPGTLRPKPGFQELKRRIRSRLPANLANASSIKPVRKLASIMNSKV